MKGKSKLYSFLSCVTLLMFSSENVLFALIVKDIIESIEKNNYENFVLYTIICVILAVTMFVIGILSRHFTLKYVQIRLEEAKNNVYENYIMSEYKSNDAYDISMFSTNIELLYSNYYIQKLYIPYYIGEFIFTVCAIIYINWILFIVAIITSLLPLLAPIIFKKKMAKCVNEFTSENDNYLKSVTDSFNGMYEIKSLGAQEFFLNNQYKKNHILELKRKASKLVNYSANLTSSTLGSLSFMAIIVVCGILIMRNSLTLGAMYALIQLMNTLVGPVSNISSSLNEIKSVKELERKYKEKNQSKTNVDNKILFKDNIVLDNFSYQYGNEKTIFNNVDFKFEKGKKYAIIGESGIGKSTLAKAIAGINRDYKGKILVDGVDIKDINQSSYFNLCTYVNQDTYIFSDTIENNLKMGKKFSNIDNILKFLNIDGFVKEKGLLSNISNKDSISGGQKQRLILSRVLLSNPGILILDEPTANIDLSTSLSIINNLVSMDDLTLIVITHETNDDYLGAFDYIINISDNSLSFNA